MNDADRLGWWTISGDAFLRALHRAHEGEDPELVYMEHYVNSDHDTVEGSS